MRFALRVVGHTGIARGDAARAVGLYVAHYVPEECDGEGWAEFTRDASQARTFDSTEAAMACWRQVPANKPTRLDGRPNRPLTAYTVEVVRVS